MNNNFVLYQESLELKKLGFDKECFGWYNYGTLCIFGDDRLLDTYAGDENRPFAPTFSQAFDFFRDEYGIHSYIKRLTSGAFIYKIDWFEEDKHNKIIWEHKSYSFEEVKLELIKKLIELCKKTFMKN